MSVRKLLRFALIAFVCWFVIEPPTAEAYIGPGAGFAREKRRVKSRACVTFVSS